MDLRVDQLTNPQPDGRKNITLYVYRYTEGLPHGPWPRASNKLKRALVGNVR